MSQELVNKLNVMVAEQERRAAEFAAHQHSLSSLPQQTVPSVPSANIFSPKSLTDVSQATRQVRSAPLPGSVARERQTSPGRTAPPPQPPVRSSLAGLTRPTGRGKASDFPPPGSSFPPPVSEEGKGVSINAGTLIVVLLIGLALLRSCGS